MKTKLQIVNETAEYYANNPRGMKGIYCSYLSPNDSMCAVGRCFRDDVLEFRSTCLSSKVIAGFEFTASVGQHNDPEDFLKDEYKGHEIKFWMRLQSFHDVKTHWKNGEITALGQQYLEYLRKEYREA